MHCNYCQTTNLRQSRHYNIENVRQRFNPTYFHSQIFGTTQPLPSKVRCTPTFHSQAFRIDGYGHNCKNKGAKKSDALQKNIDVGMDARKTYKNGDFTNSRGKSCYNGRVKWYDEQKNDKFNHIQSTYDYSRERKYADLASSSVFDNYVYQSHPQNQLCNCVNCHCVNCHCGQNKKQDIQSKKIQAQKSQGCVCRVCNCVNCQCGTKQTYCEPPDSLQTKQQIQVPQHFACTNCQYVNCKCGKPVEAKTCKCNSCQCINCNCESGCCQKAPLNQKIVEQVKPVVTINKGTNQQVTFGKKGVINAQKGFSQPKKVIKEKPTYTVIRQKK